MVKIVIFQRIFHFENKTLRDIGIGFHGLLLARSSDPQNKLKQSHFENE